MTVIAYRLGYFTAWLFNADGMPLGIAIGDQIVIGGIAIGLLVLVGML